MNFHAIISIITMVGTVTSRQRGFTLIEIVIVLAIAAALILLVFLAVSGTQKSKRDQIRKTEAGQIMAALEQYYNNNGDSFAGLYMIGLPSSYLKNITEPTSGATPEYEYYPLAGPGIMEYYTGYICATSIYGTQAMGPGGASNYAVLYWSESAGAAVCVDNT